MFLYFISGWCWVEMVFTPNFSSNSFTLFVAIITTWITSINYSIVNFLPVKASSFKLSMILFLVYIFDILIHQNNRNVQLWKFSQMLKLTFHHTDKTHDGPSRKVLIATGFKIRKQTILRLASESW